MSAGFALAALLSDDRDLAHVESAVPEHALPALQAQLGLAAERESGVRALLSVLRPELQARSVEPFSPRMRGLLARLLPAPARRPLLADAPASRADFNVDEDLLAALTRIARCSAKREKP
jgi:hypothetical protein